MKIYNISSIDYISKKTPVSQPGFKKSAANFTRDEFYAQIEGFLNKQYSKEKYFKMFSDGVDKIVKQQEFSKYSVAERKYINDIVSLLDMSEDLKDISERTLKKNMMELLAHKK